MGLFRKLSLRPPRYSVVSSHFGTSFPTLRKHAGIELVGVFAFAGAAAAITFGNQPTEAHHANQQPSSAPIQSTPTASSPATTPLNSFIDSDSASLNNSSSTSSNTGSTSTRVTVNGQPVEVPNNGSVHKTLATSDGQTSVDISNTSTTSGDTASGTTTTNNLQVFSESSGSSNTSVHINNSTTSP